MPLLSDFIIEVERRPVLKRLGLKFPQEVRNPLVENLVHTEIDDSLPLIEPKGIYEKFPIRIEGSSIIRIEGGFTISSSKLTKWLGESTGIALMAVTIGGKVEERAARLIREGESTRGVIVDAIGSVAVEGLAELMERLISREAGFRTRKRFSCGYSDWALSDQKKILELLDAERIGLKVNKNFLIIPEKSITAAIGLY